jgi:hypothetical protein
MDLSKVKWVVIAIVVLGSIWLVTSPGINYMIGRFTAHEVGADPKRDVFDEAGLTRVGTFLMMTGRYASADSVFDTSLDRYPDGKNANYNYFRQARCAEKAKDPRRAVIILEDLIDMNAHADDERIPENDALRLRADKIIELNELGEIRPKDAPRKLL